MITTKKISSATYSEVSIRFAATSPIRYGYSDRVMLPDFVFVTYRYETQIGPGGWMQHLWVADEVKVAGHRVLKPAKDGSIRTGQDRGQSTWYRRDDQLKSLDNSGSLPEEIVTLIERFAPSGEVQVPNH